MKETNHNRFAVETFAVDFFIIKKRWKKTSTSKQVHLFHNFQGKKRLQTNDLVIEVPWKQGDMLMTRLKVEVEE